MFVKDVLLHERHRFEKLLTALAAELAFVFLFDMRFDSFSKRAKG